MAKAHITGRFLLPATESQSTQLVPLKGRVFFTPAITIRDTDGIKPPATVMCRLDDEGYLTFDGTRGVDLDVPGIDNQSEGWTWEVSATIKYKGAVIPFESFNIDVKAGQTADLKDLMPVETSTGEVVTRGIGVQGVAIEGEDLVFTLTDGSTQRVTLPAPAPAPAPEPVPAPATAPVQDSGWRAVPFSYSVQTPDGFQESTDSFAIRRYGNRVLFRAVLSLMTDTEGYSPFLSMDIPQGFTTYGIPDTTGVYNAYAAVTQGVLLDGMATGSAADGSYRTLTWENLRNMYVEFSKADFQSVAILATRIGGFAPSSPITLELTGAWDALPDTFDGVVYPNELPEVLPGYEIARSTAKPGRE